MQKYLPHIDGLRAVAVLPVLFFHAGIGLFSGGYVGVDVFFVISGYLITSILLAEIEQNNFSILTFYERRARRILPALFLVVLISSLAAFVIMRPTELIQFGRSLIAVSLFVSNILFWREAGYFETSSEEKPLLHTWSLAVEEQYYLLFPLFLLLAFRFLPRKSVAVTLILVGVGSLALAEFASRNYPVPNFYLGPTRAWELLAGSICAFVGMRNEARGAQYFSAIGLIFIGAAIFGFDASTPFPSTYTLLPVIGTCLIIVYGAKSYTGHLLSISPMIWTGLLSYSIYLWHQPVLAFFRLATEDVALNLPLYMAVVIGLAYLSWRLVEQPFRDKKRISRRTVFWFSGLGMSGFVVLGTLFIYTNGAESRFSADELAFIQPTHSEYSCAARPSPHFAGVASCTFGAEKGQRKIAVLGDSHVDALAIGFDPLFTKKGYQATRYNFPNCHPILGIHDSRHRTPAQCDALLDSLPAYLAENYDEIILHIRWTFRLYPIEGAITSLNFDNQESGVEHKNTPRVNYVRRNGRDMSGDGKRHALETYIGKLRSTNLPLTIVGPVPEPGWHVGQTNMKHYLRGESMTALSTSYDLFQVRNRYVLTALASFEGLSNVRVFYPHQSLCSQASGRCAVQNDETTLYWDDDHLSKEGAELVVGDFVWQ
ncbi:acyltransferase [Alphaproteobacteria bacterium]|nr:acyltransferase [Alphaproteobacteria bacterium]